MIYPKTVIRQIKASDQKIKEHYWEELNDEDITRSTACNIFNVTHTYLIARYINAECRSYRWKQLDTKTGDITREIYS